METFDPTKHEVFIRKAVNGYIVNVGCCGPIVIHDDRQLEEELRGFFSGNLGPIGHRVLAKHLEQRSVENTGGQAAICAPPMPTANKY